MSKTFLVWFFVFLIVTGAVFGGFFNAAQAATNAGLTDGEVLAAVNSLRASLGLPAYPMDASLKAYAQQHAEYMANTGNLTHTHSDGTRPWEHGISENIAFGENMSLSGAFLVNQAWADAVHMKTMTYATGVAGVGVAIRDTRVYVALDVRAGAGAKAPADTPLATPGTPVKPSATPPGYKAPTATSNIIVPVQKATPGPDGSVVHEVQNGQSLWAIAIAYEVKIADIRKLNGIPENSNNIYVGQKLIIKPASMTLTPTLEGTLPAAFDSLAVDTEGTPSAELKTTFQPTLALRSMDASDQLTAIQTSTPTPGGETGNPDSSASLAVLPLTARATSQQTPSAPAPGTAQRSAPAWVRFIGYHAETIVLVIFSLAAAGILGLFILGVRKK